MEPTILMLAAFTIASYGLWGFMLKFSINKIGLWPAVAVGFSTAIFISLAVAAYAISRAGSFPTLNIYSAGLVLAVILSTLGVLATYLMLEKAKVSIVIPLLELYLIIPVILGVFILKEQLTTAQIAGMVFAIAAAVLLSL